MRMRVIIVIQVLLGLMLLAVIPAAGGGAGPIVTGLQAAGGLGLLAAATVAPRAAPDRALDLWGTVGVLMAAWTFVVCFAAALSGRYALVGVDLTAGIVSSGLGSWVALRT
jgi:hypothetical protein